MIDKLPEEVTDIPKTWAGEVVPRTSDEPVTSDVLKKLSQLISSEHHKTVYLLLFGFIIMGILEVAGIASIMPFISVATDPSTIYSNQYLKEAYIFFNEPGERIFILVLGLGAVFLLLLANTTASFINWKMIFFARMQELHISYRLLSQYTEMPYEFFLARSSSDLSKNILNEVRRITEGMVLQSIDLISRIVVVLFIISLLLIVDPLLAISSLVILSGVYFLIYWSLNKYLNKLGQQTIGLVGKRYKSASDLLGGIKAIKLKKSEAFFLNRYKQSTMTYSQNIAKQSVIALLPRYLLEIVAFGGIIMITLYLVYQGKNESSIMPLLSLYAFAGYRLMPNLQSIYAAIVSYRFYSPVLDLLIDDLAKTKPKEENTNQNFDHKKYSQPIKFQEEINLSNVTFQYKGTTKDVITNLNLRIEHNKTIGIVGESGSGKSTVVDIILGLLTPSEGSIKIDSVDLNRNNIGSWRTMVGYVPQSIFLIDDTIANNIAFGIPADEIETDRIFTALKLSNLDKFIDQLPDKHHTFVGERGVRLSGGQRQRIGIARALYSVPDVLILDEATSSIDGNTEKAIVDSINKLMNTKTVIIVAHRMNTVAKCDVIYVLNDGVIVDSGKYEDLSKNSKIFKELAQLNPRNK